MNVLNPLSLSMAIALTLTPWIVTASPQAAARAVAPQVATPAASNVTPVADDAQRVLALEGAWNVRTFAGLQGRNGPIPATAFVRTADLSRLTAADRDTLAAAGVKLDIDLRTNDELQQSPDVLANDARFDYQRISLMGTEKMDLQKMMTSFPDSLGAAYVQWLGSNQPQFRDVFQRIAAQQDGAVLYHCTAGKDRTGWATAVILTLLGVPRETVMADYLASNDYLRAKNEATYAMLAKAAGAGPLPGGLDRAKLEPVLGVRPEYLQAAFDEAERAYGSFDAYVKNGLGLSDADVAALKARYLTGLPS